MVQEMVGFDPATAGPVTARRVMGLMAAIATRTVPSRVFTEITFLVCNVTSRVKCRCPPSPDCPRPLERGVAFFPRGTSEYRPLSAKSSSQGD
jgi:hypothetical protein